MMIPSFINHKGAIIVNNNHVGETKYPAGNTPANPVMPQQPSQAVPQPVRPIYQQPVTPQTPIMNQPVRQVYQQPARPQTPVMNQPVRPVYQQPARPQTPVMNQPVRPVYQQPVQSVPQPVRPVYQQPFFVPQPVVRPTQPYTLQAREAISSMNKALFVILSVLFGWICGRSLLSFEYGIGMTALGLSFYLIYLPFIMIKQKKNFSLFGLLLFIPQTIILASFSFFSDSRVVIIGLLASFIIAAVQTTMLANCTTGKPFTFDLLCDTCITYLAMPFMNFSTTMSGIFFGKDKNEKKSKTPLKIAIGAAISLPVVLTLIMTFSFADEMFAAWVDKLLLVLNLNPLRITADILFALIVMLYVMPLVVTLRSGYRKQYNHKESRRFFDPIITSTVLFASSVVYLVFVAVQFTYLFAGSGNLPDGLTLAEYSRRGFFELVFVIVITTIIMGVVCMLTKNNKHDRLPVYVKIALLIIIASNAVIIVSAARRLLIYIENYNLTVSRFNAAVLIALMAVVDLVLALRIIFDRLSVSAIIGSIVAMTVAAYCIFNVDGFVAKYNIDQYLDNPTRYDIDINYIAEDLSPAAVPQLERLMNKAPDNKTRTQAKFAIAHIADKCNLFEGDNKHLARWTLDRQIAVNIFEKYNITQRMADEYYDNYVYSYSDYGYR